MNALPKRQRGVALLVALLVVALAVILIAALLDRGELAFARTRNALRSEQADAYAQGLEIYAAQVLSKVQTEQPGPDTNQSPWAQPLPPQPVSGGVISAKMRDLNGCFNLNNLSPKSHDSAKWIGIFQQLLPKLGISDPNLAKAVQSWFVPGGQGEVSTNVYLAQPIPYRPRSDVFAHVSELRLVAGVTADVYAKLAPYVCALPPGTALNVNTAAPPLLQSIVQNLSAAKAAAIWNNGQANYRDVGTFATDAGIAQLQVSTLLPATMFDVVSTYFLARGDIVLDDVPFTFYSLIERPPLHGPNPRRGIRVLARSRGSDDTLTVAAPIAPSSKDDAALD